MGSKLYVSDLDHTLARNDETISKYTRDAINTLYENDILFTIASGRNYKSMLPMLKGIKLHLPLIENNGGFITDISSGEHLVTNSINFEFAKNICQIGEECKLEPIIFSIDGKREFINYPTKQISNGIQDYITYYERLNDNRLRQMDTLDKLFNDKIIKINYIGKELELRELSEHLSQYSHIINYYYYENKYAPGEYWITVHDKKSSKENALDQMRKMYKLDESELVVFGDNINDIGMFKLANRSYAVNNASPELKKIATKIINDHEDDSVANFILRENNLIQN